MLNTYVKFKELLNKVTNKETVLWSGNSAGGNAINVNVNGYKRLRVKVRMSGIIDFLEIDLNIQTINIEKNGVYYKYGNSAAAGAMDGTQYLNKASVAVSGDKTKVIGYGFGYSSLANGWNFQDRDGSTDVWGVLEIVGIK